MKESGVGPSIGGRERYNPMVNLWSWLSVEAGRTQDLSRRFTPTRGALQKLD